MQKDSISFGWDRLAKNQGFTLIELTIVLSIFAIIIAAAWVLIGNAMQSQRDNRVSQQIISILENTRNYARKVDSSTLSLDTQGLCNLGLLPKDIGGVNVTPCPAAGGTNYTAALGATNYIDACAAGGTNKTTCGGGGLLNTVAVYPQNLTSVDCTAVLTKLSNDVTDLGFTQYVVNGKVFLTSTAANLTLANIATKCTPAGGGNTVNLELDFSF